MGENINWKKMIQNIVLEIDKSIRQKDDEIVSLSKISSMFGFSVFHFSKKFKEISGMQFREYLGLRKLALALKDVRDSDKGFLDIALDYGFSSHEAFSRSFKKSYGITPKDFRKNPVPVKLRTILRPWDCYLLDIGGSIMTKKNTEDEVKVYFVTIPKHKFLHIKNYESIGYFDFWEKQSKIPEQDCETICGLLDSIKGKLDDFGGFENDSSSGQIMAFENCEKGRICSWGIPLAECYGARLPEDYKGEVPKQMILQDVPEGEYIVFEHGPFDFESENQLVEAKIEEAMKNFDYEKSGYELDFTEGRFFYFYHDCKRFWKYVRPVKKSN